MTRIFVPPECRTSTSIRIDQTCAAIIEGLHRCLTISYESGRTTGPEFDRVIHLIQQRDMLVLDESTLTTECIGQLLGGN